MITEQRCGDLEHVGARGCLADRHHLAARILWIAEEISFDPPRLTRQIARGTAFVRLLEQRARQADMRASM